ncbi:MAG: cytochrome C [Desulfuromonadaceae bacterium]|nr:cytochrome C [Desulfuromonadaceae bacterium]
MKRLAIVLSVIAVTLPAMATEKASLDKGKELFTSSQLATNGKSCNMCHPNGKGLFKAAGYDDETLGNIINQCIKNPLASTALDSNSVEMKSLLQYIKSLDSSTKR